MKGNTVNEYMASIALRFGGTKVTRLTSSSSFHVTVHRQPKFIPNKTLWERALQRLGCGLIVNAENSKKRYFSG